MHIFWEITDHVTLLFASENCLSSGISVSVCHSILLLDTMLITRMHCSYISCDLCFYSSIEARSFINAGTAGGFKVKGACIFDVFLVSDLAFHDRRIPIPGPDKYGLGRRKSLSTPNLVKELNLKVCKLSTGDSLDMSPQDEICILANDATVVDMEVKHADYQFMGLRGHDLSQMSRVCCGKMMEDSYEEGMVSLQKINLGLDGFHFNAVRAIALPHNALSNRLCVSIFMLTFKKKWRWIALQLLDTLRRDVVGVEVDNSNDGATGASRISQSNEENVVDLQLALWNDVDKKHVGSEMFDKKWTKRDQKIDHGENLTIYSKNVVGDEVKNIGDWLSWPTYEASKGWFLQMTDSLDKIDNVFNQLMHIDYWITVIKYHFSSFREQAYVSSLMRVPAIFIKTVSNFVDGEKSIPEEFAENLQATVVALGEVVANVVEFINGKCLSEL
ncbi:nucleoside phosphorylase [Artemisia annua]|uniref:Nucleoside phosphorylase n=1 Tax=Artemisia annua TaxID=35608 RepID=A0A2U1MQR3_ARTAN|nr:nucleoside phosphorylase [Artemisia annua]